MNKKRLHKGKIVFASMIGNALEFYDFSLYGFFAPLFAKLFFPVTESLTQLFNCLAVFAVGFMTRPLGSIIFGHIGDRFGRKKALTLSIILMGVPTFCIGILPTYDQIGLLAPFLLILFRLLQGFCVGGENNGSAIFLIEHSNKSYSGFVGAIILTGGAIGTLLGMLLSSLSLLSVMPEWAWRIPFIFGLVIGIIGFYIRKRISETPDFAKIVSNKSISNSPFKEVIINYPISVLCTAGVGGLNGILSTTLVAYSSVYLNIVVGIKLSHSILVSALGLTIFAFSAPLMGRISDKFNQSNVMICGSLALLIFAYPFYYLLNSGNYYIALIGLALLMGSFNGPTNAFLNTLFPVKYRYSGVAFGYAIGIAILGGTSPFFCNLLLEITNWPFAPSLYLTFGIFIGLFSVLYGKNISKNLS